MLFGYPSKVPCMAIENLAVSCSFTPVSSCLSGDSLLETDFSVFGIPFFFVCIGIRSETMGTAFVCSERSVHHITDYAISVLGTGRKVVIKHCNMAMRDTCKPTSGSRGWDLLGGCCEGRGVSACHALSSLSASAPVVPGLQAEAGLLSKDAFSSWWWCLTSAVPSC